mgnify:CR=1 FL=1
MFTVVVIAVVVNRVTAVCAAASLSPPPASLSPPFTALLTAVRTTQAVAVPATIITITATAAAVIPFSFVIFLIAVFFSLVAVVAFVAY